jgi:hypothetical protein
MSGMSAGAPAFAFERAIMASLKDGKPEFKGSGPVCHQAGQKSTVLFMYAARSARDALEADTH